MQITTTPEPFSTHTLFRFTIHKSGLVLLAVFDVAGKQLCELINQPLAAGEYEVLYEPKELIAGVYMYRFETKYGLITRRILLELNTQQQTSEY